LPVDVAGAGAVGTVRAALGAMLTGGLASVQWAYYKKHM
jgi:hypothetical protein